MQINMQMSTLQTAVGSGPDQRVQKLIPSRLLLSPPYQQQSEGRRLGVRLCLALGARKNGDQTKPLLESGWTGVGGQGAPVEGRGGGGK